MKILKSHITRNILILGMFSLIFSISCSRSNVDSNSNNTLSSLTINVDIIGASTSNPNGDGTGAFKIQQRLITLHRIV